MQHFQLKETTSFFNNHDRKYKVSVQMERIRFALAEFAGLVATRGLKALISYSGDDVMVQYEDVSLRPLVTRLKRWG